MTTKTRVRPNAATENSLPQNARRQARLVAEGLAKHLRDETTLPTGLSLAGYNRTAFTLRGHRVIVAAKLLVVARGTGAEDAAFAHLDQMVSELESAEEAAARLPGGPPAPIENSRLATGLKSTGRNLDPKIKPPSLKLTSADVIPRKPPLPLPPDVVEYLEKRELPAVASIVRQKLPPVVRAKSRGRNKPRMNTEQRAEIVRLYVSERRSANDVAHRFGISNQGVLSIVRRSGHATRGRGVRSVREAA